MGPTAQLTAVLTYLDHPHRIAVFLIKDRDDSRALHILERHLAGAHGIIGNNHLVHPPFHRRELGGRQRLEIVKVKPQSIRTHHRARLLDAAANDIAKGMLQEMGGGMMTCHRRPPLRVNRGRHLGSLRHRAPGHTPDMQHNPFSRLPRVGHLKVTRRTCDDPVITQLTALLGIKRSLSQ